MNLHVKDDTLGNVWENGSRLGISMFCIEVEISAKTNNKMNSNVTSLKGRASLS